MSTDPTHETTAISARIQDHNDGKITDDELAEYLTNEVKYKPGAINPFDVGTADWYNWSEGGKPYVPGSFGEVTKARDTGLLSPDVFDRVMAEFHNRMT